MTTDNTQVELVCDRCHAKVDESDKTCWNCDHTTFVYEGSDEQTDNTQELDAILEQAYLDGASDTMWQDERHVEIFATAKQRLLDWHNKQIEEVLDRLVSQKATCYDCGHDNEAMATVPYIPVTAIEAERQALYGKDEK